MEKATAALVLPDRLRAVDADSTLSVAIKPTRLADVAVTLRAVLDNDATDRPSERCKNAVHVPADTFTKVIMVTTAVDIGILLPDARIDPLTVASPFMYPSITDPVGRVLSPRYASNSPLEGSVKAPDTVATQPATRVARSCAGAYVGAVVNAVSCRVNVVVYFGTDCKAVATDKFVAV